MAYGTVINPTKTGSWPRPCWLNSVITRNVAGIAANHNVVITTPLRYEENENKVKSKTGFRPAARYRFSQRTNATAVIAPRGRKSHRIGASPEPVVSTNGNIANNTELANNATPTRSRSAGPALGWPEGISHSANGIIINAKGTFMPKVQRQPSSEPKLPRKSPPRVGPNAVPNPMAAPKIPKA